jgi:hypothetical protein
MRQITHTPRLVKNEMTLGELKAFIAEADRSEIPDSALIEVRVSGFATQRIREISADDRHLADEKGIKKR